MADAKQWFEDGEKWFHKEFLNDAIFCFAKATEENDQPARAHIYLGRCYAIKLLPEIAIGHFQKAQQLDSELEEVGYWLELVHQRRYLISVHSDLFQRTFWTERDDADAHFKLGSVFARWRLYDEVVGEMKAVLNVNPENLIAWYNLGLAHQELGELSKAMDAYKKAIDIDPQFALVWYNLGLVHHKQGEFGKAIEAYYKVIDIAPRFAPAWDNLGHAHLCQGELSKAIEACQKAIDIDPQDATAWHNLGHAHLYQGEFSKAIEACQRAIGIDPQYVSTWNILGLAYLDQGKLSKAIETFHKAIDIDPQDAPTWNNLGRVHHKQEELSKAIEAYHKAIDIDPQYVPAWSNFGLACRHQGELSEAIEACQKAISIDAHFAPAWNNLGLAYMEKGELSKAIEACQKATDIDPQDAPIWNDLGRVHHKQGELSKAIEAYHKAISVDPQFEPAWHNLGLVHMEKGELSKAIETFHKAIGIDPQFVPAWHNLGLVHIEKGELSKAIEACQKAIDIDPQYVPAWNNLGLAYQKQGNLDKAIGTYKEAQVLELGKDIPLLWTNLARCYNEQGEAGEALCLLETARQRFHSSAIVYHTMGEICYSKSVSTAILSSIEKQGQWLRRALDAFGKTLESTDDVSFSTSATIFWVSCMLRQDGLSATIKQVAQRLAPLFSDYPGRLLLANLVALLMHFVEMLREMCLRDLRSAKGYCEEFIHNPEPSHDTGVVSSSEKYEDGINQLKALHAKYRNLYSGNIFLAQNEYKELRDYAEKSVSPPALKNLLRTVQILVSKWVEEIANLCFLAAALEPQQLVKIYREEIETFELQLREVGGFSEETLKVIYGQAIQTIYQACGKGNGRGKLAPLRHSIATPYAFISRELGQIAEASRPNRDSNVQQRSVATIGKCLSLIQQNIEMHLEAVTQPVEFRLGQVLKSLNVRIQDASGDDSVYGLRPIVVTIFTNIVSNAREHLQAYIGDPEKRRIDVTVSCNDRNYITVSFCDNGKGIPQEVTDPWYQGKDTVPSTKGGTVHGSGLVIVRDLTCAIGGKPDILPIPNGGTMVKVTIPRHFGTGYELMASEPATSSPEPSLTHAGPNI